MAGGDGRKCELLWFEYRGKPWTVPKDMAKQYKLSLRDPHLDYTTILLNDVCGKPEARLPEVLAYCSPCARGIGIDIAVAGGAGAGAGMATAGEAGDTASKAGGRRQQG